MDFFGMGIWEILLIIIVAFIVIGPDKIPGVARSIGKTIRAIKKASSDFTSQVSKELEADENHISESTSSIRDTFKQLIDEGTKIATNPGDEKNQTTGKREKS